MIERNWQELIRPEKPQIEVGSDAQRKARLVAEPLERGFGVTLGNALRRVLLSSLQGAAVTAIQIDGVVHEFSSLEGVREDVVDIVLNIKQLALRMHAEGPKRMTLRATGPGPVTAGQIDAPADIEVLNTDHVICTLDDGASIRMELTVQNGKGYVAAEFNRPEDAPIGLIAVDALYSPVKRVAYRVEPTRQGQSLDYDKLLLEVETNGAVSPVDAVAYASRILQDQLQIFITFDEPKKAVEASEGKPVLWVNGITMPWTNNPHYANENIQKLNASLVEATDRYDNLRIYDWSADATPHPEWFLEDDANHNNAEGSAAKAEHMAKALVAAFPKDEDPVKEKVVRVE